MLLHIQDPLDDNTLTLHESIINACKRFNIGGGVFSFATRDGVNLLLDDIQFRPLLEEGHFKLIIGLDDITNMRTIEILHHFTQLYRGLEVSMFYHNLRNSIFHPKFCWFGNNNSGKIIIGSGNLTVRGLRRNWESFIELNLRNSDYANHRTFWDEWIIENNAFLRSIDDPDVIRLAQINSDLSARISGRRKEAIQEDLLDTEGEIIQNDYPVLIAEIPRGSRRWNQANFDIETFRRYFGASINRSHRIILQHVNDDRSLSEIENRPSVAVASHNYRFELGAGSGRPYPAHGRPIGIFIKTSKRAFYYRLTLPNDNDYNCIERFLATNISPNPNRLRRFITTVLELRNNCPESPILSVI